jgi:uncharacterized protein (DUF697 family)
MEWNTQHAPSTIFSCIRGLTAKGDFLMTKRTEAEKIINKHMIWAMGGGLIPLPVLDFAAVTAIQIDMLNQLSRLYEVDYDAATGKTFVAALTGSTLAKLGSSMVKIIPGFGTLLGGVSMSILSGASTFAVGRVAVEQFESGGGLFDVNWEATKKMYQDFFEEGTIFAENLQREQPAAADEAAPSSAASMIAELERLESLRSKGVITDEEFAALKAKLMADA